jgi:hypothetical protein
MKGRFGRDAGAPLPHFTTRDLGRTRVVIEDADGAGRWAAERCLKGVGYAVVSCGGPDLLARRRCPLEEDVDCPAIADADVVVSTLRLGDRRERAVIAGIRARYPDTPLVIQATPMAAHRHRDLLAGCHVLTTFTGTALRHAVDEVLAPIG